MSGLHRLPYHSNQVVIEGFQVCLVPEFDREGFEGPSGIILPSVEASVYKPLYAVSQRREQCCYQEGGCDDREGGLLAGERDEDPLQHYDAAEVEYNQRDRKCAVDQCTVDDEVYLVEAVFEDCKAHGNWHPGKTKHRHIGEKLEPPGDLR